MRCLVIGASGHLGAHLCRALLVGGAHVRALVRPTSDLRGLDGLDAELARGDVRNAVSLARALDGCDAACHLAAPTSLGPGLSESIVDGTRNVLHQARRCGVGRVLYVSSTVTVGYSAGPTVLDERHAVLTPASAYHVAKWHAEQEALTFHRRHGLPVVVVNPSAVVGPLDFRVTPSNAPIQRGLDRGLPFCLDGGVTPVHAADVARGCVLALQQGRPGERYILGGDPISLPDYFRLICELCHRRPPRFKVPRLAMLGLGAGFSLLGAAGVRNLPFTYGQARLAGSYAWYSSRKAAEELGYSWRPVREAVASYLDWKRGQATPSPARQAA